MEKLVMSRKNKSGTWHVITGTVRINNIDFYTTVCGDIVKLSNARFRTEPLPKNFNRKCKCFEWNGEDNKYVPRKTRL